MLKQVLSKFNHREHSMAVPRCVLCGSSFSPVFHVTIDIALKQAH